MFVDISHSTEMSLSLPERKFALLVQCFAQEVSIAAIDYGGYVFKYEGDGVIVIFPAEQDEVKACENALNCSKTILEVIKVSNTAFSAYELPEISVRIGMTYGYGLVVLYGNDSEKAYIDMIGSSISLASKIVSIADPNRILVGEYFYSIVHSSKSINCSNFAELILDPIKWKYLSRSDPHSRFRVYEYY
jgi:adenylate cyclase